MKRSTLSPEQQAAWLRDTFARNRARFGGLRMMADDGDAGDGGDGASGDADAAGQGNGAGDQSADSGDALGEGGKKALQAERDRAKAAEDAAKATKGEFETFRNSILEGFGIKPEGEEKTIQQELDSVRGQIAGMQREAAVLKLANTHRITDEDDLELLRSAKDDEAMKRLAERLAPSADESDDKGKPRRPKPDPSQGGGTSGGADNSGVSHGRDLFKASRGSSKAS